MGRDSQKEKQALVMKVYCIRLAAVLFSLVAGKSKTKRAQNENFRQAHLSFTGDDSRIGLDFVSSRTTGEPIVQWRKGSNHEMEGNVTTEKYELKNVGIVNNCEMGPLENGAHYQYRVVADNGNGDASEWIDFMSPPYDREGGERAAVFADFGLANDVSMGFITSDKDVDYMIHVGDIAYDLEDNNSTVGNEFMNIMSAQAQHTPYMVAVGNHELHTSPTNGTEFVQRFRGIASHAGKRSGSESNFYYSFDRGLIHYCVINTEVYHWIDNLKYSPLPHTVEEQLEWLEKDLAKVDRSKTPWIVAMGHKAWYMSTWNNVGWKKEDGLPQTNWTAFEPLFCKYGVELYLSGHVHLYQRFFPLHGPNSLMLWAKPQAVDHDSVSDDTHIYKNPKWMTTLIVASPGDDQISTRLDCKGLTADVDFNPMQDTQAICTAGYGYGHLQAVNSTHLLWEFYQTGKAPNVGETDVGDAVKFKKKKRRDYLWLQVDNHGKREYC